MQYNDLIYGLGDFFHWTFKILPVLGNLPNYIFIVLMIFGTAYWLRWQKQMIDEARSNGKPE